MWFFTVVLIILAGYFLYCALTDWADNHQHELETVQHASLKTSLYENHEYKNHEYKSTQTDPTAIKISSVENSNSVESLGQTLVTELLSVIHRFKGNASYLYAVLKRKSLVSFAGQVSLRQLGVSTKDAVVSGVGHGLETAGKSLNQVKSSLRDEHRATSSKRDDSNDDGSNEYAPAIDRVVAGGSRNRLQEKKQRENRELSETSAKTAASKSEDIQSRGSKNGQILSFHTNSDEKNDLTKIKGIGPVIQKSLNKMGVYCFYQIAEFGQEDVDNINAELNFPGRIERDEWIKQAEALWSKS